MHQDSFRSVVCRSLSKSLPSRSKDGSHHEAAQCAVPCVAKLQQTVCRGCQGRDRSPSRSSCEVRAMSSQRDIQMTTSLSRHFAEDLLRGAMDLQESLAMLEKFQAVSRSVQCSNKKRKPELGEKIAEMTGIHEVLLEASNAKKVVPRSVDRGLHVQSWDSTDELKKVIKESLYRHNLLSVSPGDEQAHLCRSLRCSLSNSSTTETSKQNNVSPTSLSSPVSVQPDKSKSRSLIAKLMGLNELPTDDAHIIKKDEKVRTVSSPKARFDIEMPKMTKPPQSLGKGSDPNRKAMQEIMETMQFKGLLKIMQADELMVQQRDVVMKSPCSDKGAVQGSLLLSDTLVANEVSVKFSNGEKTIKQTQDRSPKDVKVESPISHKQKISRRTSGKTKAHLTERKREERKDMKAQTASAPHSQANVVQKRDKKSVASISSGTCHNTKPVLRNTPNNSRKKPAASRKIKNSAIAKTVAQDRKCKEYIEAIHAPDLINCPSTEHSTSPSNESCQTTDWDAEPSMEDEIRKGQSKLGEALATTANVGRIDSLVEDASCQSTDKFSMKGVEIKDEMTLLLLSDHSFLTRALELLGIDTYKHPIPQCKDFPKVQMKNCKLYLDMASEQLERKHHQPKGLCHTAFQNQKSSSTTCFSLEALLKDIVNATRKLNCYTDDDDCITKDNLYIKLEWDLRCTDVLINSMWDMGWQDWICMEETKCFAVDVGEHILSLLIEEVLWLG